MLSREVCLRFKMAKVQLITASLPAHAPPLKLGTG